MLHLVADFGPSSTSPTFETYYYEPFNICATGEWDSNTLTVQFNPAPDKGAPWTDLQQNGSTVTLTATDNAKALVFTGGVSLRLVSTTGASTDLDIWVGGGGVVLKYPEGITQADYVAL